MGREDAVGPRLQSKIGAIDQQDAGTSVRSVGSLKVSEDAFDLVFFRQGNGHVEPQPNDMTLEVLPGEQCAQLVDVATLHVNPSPEADRRRFNSWTRSVAEQRNECDAAGTRLVKVRRFRSSGVDGRGPADFQ